MMYNDVDNDLPPFNDSIDGEEIFLFSNHTRNSSSNNGSSFLNVYEDEHLNVHNNVNGPNSSSHLPVDVDDILLNSNFLEQPNCDQTEDLLIWNITDISDDRLNELLASQCQLNLANNNINNNSNINNNNNNTTSNLIHQQQAPTIPLQLPEQSVITLPPQSATTISTPLLPSQATSNSISQQQQPPPQQQTQLHNQIIQDQQQPIQHHPNTVISQPPTQTTTQLGLVWVAEPNQQPQQTIDQCQQQISNNTFTEVKPTVVQSQSAISKDLDNTRQTTSIRAATTDNVSSNWRCCPPGNIVWVDNPSDHQHHQQLHQQNQHTSIDNSCSTTNNNYDNVSSMKKQETVNVKTAKPKDKQTRLDCPYCKRSFSKNFDLQQHMRCHTGEKPFQCIVCGRGFAQKSNVKKHMQAHKVWPEGHSNVPMPAGLMSNHARSRNNSASSSIGTPRNDDECMQENDLLQINNDNNNDVNNNGITIGLSNDRKNDGNDIFAENRYSCSYCQFNGRTYFELKSHLTIHKREKVFKCIVSYCGKTFSGSDLQGFLDHVTGHKDLIYHCHLCSAQFYSLNEFGEHQKNHSNVQTKKSTSTTNANTTTTTTTTTTTLTSTSSNTQQQQHSSTSVLSNQQTNNTGLRQQNHATTTTTTSKLQPQQNQRQYNQQQQVQATPAQTINNNQNNYQLYNSNSNSNNNNNNTSNNSNNINGNTNNDSRSNKNNNQKYFRCTKCMSRYTTQTALDHHLSISTHYFPCTECNKVFACERYLRRHLNTHTAIQHVCSFCDKQFKTAAYLKMHSVVHTGEKPFRCNLCEAAFNRRDKLNRHKLTHETVKKFKCPFKPHIGCTKEFNRPDKLKAHVLTHSGIRPHPCDSCTRTFSRLSRLREHKKLHHDKNDNGNHPDQSSAKPSTLKIKEENGTTSVIAIDITSSTSGKV